MKIAHIAFWTQQLEVMREFYVNYFKGKSNTKYINENKGFESYFISFENRISIEIMSRTDIIESVNHEIIGLCHIAFWIKNRSLLLAMTEKFRKDGYNIVGEPRLTGDGFFESVILDPDGNRIELVVEQTN